MEIWSSSYYQNLQWKLGQQSAICWNSFGLFRDYSLNHNIFRNTTFLFFKIENWYFQHLFEREFCATSKNFNSFSPFRQFLFYFFYSLPDWVEYCEISRFFFQTNPILKVSAFYHEKQKKVLFLKNFITLAVVSK